jgi:hypothetical protein
LLLLQWHCMTQEEQRAAKAEWTSKQAPEKKRLKLLVPGIDCASCWKRKAQTDRGQRRGQNPRHGCQLARVAGEAASPVPNPPAVPQTQAVEAYTGLGSSEAKCNNKATTNEQLQHARSVQGQDSVQTLKAIHSANKEFAWALPASTVKPKLPISPSPCSSSFHQPTWRNSHAGRNSSTSQLCREKAHITYISSSKEDAERIFTILAVDSQINSENFDKKKLFGTGERLVQQLKAEESERDFTFDCFNFWGRLKQRLIFAEATLLFQVWTL